MKLLLTTDTVGGVWTYALELAGALGAHGVSIALATMGNPPSPDQRDAARKLGHVQLFESTFKLEWMQDPWRDVAKAGDWLLEIEDQFRPDVVHLNGYAHGALPWRAPVIIVAHSCVLSWWQAVKGCPAPASYDRYREEMKRGLRAADAVVAPSDAMLQLVRRHYGALSRARVIHNGRTAIPFLAAIPKEELVLTAGRLWDEAKNVRAVASVAPHLAWPVCMAGDMNHPDGTARRHTNLHALGNLPPERLAQWFRRASIYALPARYEPFGLTALEAGLAGCALVLGNIPSLREVWGDCARFVQPDDTDALRDVLRELIRDKQQRARMSERARHRALQYTPQSMARSYLELYQQLRERPICPISPASTGVVASATDVLAAKE
jgi:glycosyltransferase involved in cell wall biosynthesis